VQWRVSIENEFTFPIFVHVYSDRGRTSLGAVPPGSTSLRALDSGQLLFTPPLGQSLIARGRQIRGVFRCLERTPPPPS